MRILTYVLAAGLIPGCVQPEGDPASPSGNRNPVIQSLSADPSAFSVGASSTITAVASDPDNQPLTYRWMASTGDFIGEGASVRYTASFCCTGPNTIQLKVQDNAGGTATRSIEVFINY
jgi:hypothetical protein